MSPLYKKLLAVCAMLAAVSSVFLIFTNIGDHLSYTKTSSLSNNSTDSIETDWKGYESKIMVIQGKRYNLLVADTQEKTEKGLMYVTYLHKYDGMVFFFDEPQILTFWNKNTLMDLHLIWMNGVDVVGEVDLPSITNSGDIVRVTSPGLANTVVELPLKK